MTARSLLLVLLLGSACARPDLRKAAPGIFTWTDTCNVHVLRDGDAALLVGIGDGSVLDRLAAIGVKRVEWVLLNDHHRELVQGAPRLDRTVTRVAAPAAERRLLETPTAFRKWRPKLGDAHTVHGASYVRPPRQPIPLDRALEDGETFTWRGREIRCVSTPGHAPGGMTYLVRHDGRTIAFSGGLMQSGARMTHWYDTEWDYGFAKGLDALTASVAKVRDLKPDLLLPEQGPAVDAPVAELSTYHARLTAFRPDYVRGYPVFGLKDPRQRDPISVPTPVRHINRVTPHLYKLSHETQGKNFAIIVADSGKGLVLDCGLFPPKMLDEIVAGMKEHLGLTSIDAFWISHMHGDHFLLGPHLKEKYGAKAWTLDRIVDPCEHPRRYDYAALVSSYGSGFDGMKIDRPFRDGERIEWEGLTLQVDWMPGQTEFGNAIWLELDGKRIVFTGDNLFGTSSDPSQNGHEAVVARNSSILEEGYLLGSRYLKDLKPDIIMGSHSFVMPEPAAFVDRYHAWAKRIISRYKELLPGPDYEYGYDPYWVSAYPYRVDLATAATREIRVTVRNFRSAPQRHRIELRLPPGVRAEPAVLEGTVPAESRRAFPVTLKADRAAMARGVQIGTFDITLDGRRYGELFDVVLWGGD